MQCVGYHRTLRTLSFKSYFNFQAPAKDSDDVHITAEDSTFASLPINSNSTCICLLTRTVHVSVNTHTTFVCTVCVCLFINTHPVFVCILARTVCVSVY
jgi:hypothetical protein